MLEDGGEGRRDLAQRTHATTCLRDTNRSTIFQLADGRRLAFDAHNIIAHSRLVRSRICHLLVLVYATAPPARIGPSGFGLNANFGGIRKNHPSNMTHVRDGEKLKLYTYSCRSVGV